MKELKKGIDCIGVTVVFFCHDGEGNFILSKRSQSCRDERGLWCPGGGAVEFGDDCLETLKREVREEYSVDILEQEFLGFRDAHRENDGIKTHWIALDFKVRVSREEVKNGEPHKFDSIEWFSLDDFPPESELHSQLPKVLQMYKDRL